MPECTFRAVSEWNALRARCKQMQRERDAARSEAAAWKAVAERGAAQLTSNESGLFTFMSETFVLSELAHLAGVEVPEEGADDAQASDA